MSGKLHIVNRPADPCPAKCPRCKGTCAMTKGHPTLLDHTCNKDKSHRW